MTFIIKNLTDLEVQLIMNSLNEKPHGQVRELFDKIEEQIVVQLKIRETDQQLEQLRKQNEISTETETKTTT